MYETGLNADIMLLMPTTPKPPADDSIRSCLLKWSRQKRLFYVLYCLYNFVWILQVIVNMVFALDPSNSVIKRLWCKEQINMIKGIYNLTQFYPIPS